MNDRGEKIITLAREMLRNPPQVNDCSSAHITMSFTVLCLVTLLTAAASSAITALSYEQKSPISRYEKTELDALVFYTAHLKGIDEGQVHEQVTSKLGINNFEEITRQDFATVRSYLEKIAQ